MDHLFFATKFQNFLLENHPDLVAILGDDFDEFVKSKADSTSLFYESLVQEGVQPGFALETSINAMKEGMLFSKYNVVYDIVEEYYYDAIENLSSKEKVDFIVNLVTQCEEVFKAYDTSDTFQYNDRLTAELLGTISIYLNR
jgi:Domain of unknown function (DUF1896).